MGNCEPDRNTVSKTFMISYNQAYRLTLEHIQVLTAEDVALLSAVDRITADNLIGRVYSPSVDVSLKDGYAVHSKDIAMACEDTPVSLCVIGTVVAGGSWHRKIGSGEAVRILSGAPIPDGVDAVIAEEFTQLSGEIRLSYSRQFLIIRLVICLRERASTKRCASWMLVNRAIPKSTAVRLMM